MIQTPETCGNQTFELIIGMVLGFDDFDISGWVWDSFLNHVSDKINARKMGKKSDDT